MRISSPTTITGAVLTTLLFASSTFAGEHNTLNGTWKLEPTKSDFAGQPVVQSGTVAIHDKQGVIVVSRSFAYKGSIETFFYTDSTGSQHNSTVRSGKNRKTKTKWDHDVLQVTTTDSGATTVERYSLNADGTMLVNVQTPEHKAFALVFQRQ